LRHRLEATKPRPAHATLRTTVNYPGRHRLAAHGMPKEHRIDDPLPDPRLLSVNVSLPREVPWEGRTVYTGIYKEPVDGPRRVRRLNIDGDGQGDLKGHGGEQRAVFVYQVESYRYWEEHLGRDAMPYGRFGENFTIQGLADDEVCVGDRYGIGQATFEVTQPRVTCYRIGMALDDPRMPSLLVAHHRPGFYLRVIEEGEVQAGDAIVKLADGPQGMTVAEIDALLYLPSKARRDLMRALQIPALSEGWKGSFRELLDRSGSAAAAEPKPAWPGFRPLRVVDVRPESDLISSFTFEVDGDVPHQLALAGQFLTIRVTPEGADAPVLRNYSLSALPDARRLRISVKRETHGIGSGYLHTRVRAGDVIEAAAPRGSFVLGVAERPVVLVSAGVGATPVLAMLHALADEDAEQEIWWVQAARNQAEHPFAAEVDGLLHGLRHAHRLLVYSRPGMRDTIVPDRVGHLGREMFDDAAIPVDADYYVCGPGPFMTAIGVALTARGVAPERVRTELFGAVAAPGPGIVGQVTRPPHAPAGGPGSGPAIAFTRSALTVPWDDRFANLLELAEACDVQVPFSCRTGVCRTCESGMLTGTVRYEPDPLEPITDDTVLMCCARPRDALTLDL
jgi:ferredoxin-NADP reductase/MOSC domain-containing protein YiiM/ferredoxin